MITGKTSSNGIRFAHGTGDRAELVRMLTPAYWMEVETVMNYSAASTNPDGVRARQVADSLRAEIPDELRPRAGTHRAHQRAPPGRTGVE